MTVYRWCERFIIAPTIELGITKDSDLDIVIWMGEDGLSPDSGRDPGPAASHRTVSR